MEIMYWILDGITGTDMSSGSGFISVWSLMGFSLVRRICRRFSCGVVDVSNSFWERIAGKNP